MATDKRSEVYELIYRDLPALTSNEVHKKPETIHELDDGIFTAFKSPYDGVILEVNFTFDEDARYIVEELLFVEDVQIVPRRPIRVGILGNNETLSYKNIYYSVKKEDMIAAMFRNHDSEAHTCEITLVLREEK